MGRRVLRRPIWDMLYFAPVKLKRVKSNHLPAWYTPEIGEARKLRDKYKFLKNGQNINYIETKPEISLEMQNAPILRTQLKHRKALAVFGNT